MEKCYLLDLERSIRTSRVTYWKPNERGYTVNLDDAGLYSRDHAEQLANSDIDKRTVVIDPQMLDNII